MDQEPKSESERPKKPDLAHIAEQLEKTDRVFVDWMGDMYKTLSHPTESGAIPVALAAVTMPFVGLGHIVLDVARHRLAADIEKEKTNETKKDEPR